MEFLILLFMLVSCVLLLSVKTDSKPLLLAILSLNIIASFAVLTIFSKTILAGAFFFINLMVSPWLLFYRLQEGIPFRRKKDPAQKKSMKDFFSGE